VIRRIVVLFLGLWLSALSALAQGTYHARFENDLVSVYELDLAAHASAASLQAARDTFWVGLTKGSISFGREQGVNPVQFDTGDVRFFPSFETKLLTNTGAAEFRGVLVSIKQRGLLSSGCECTGNTGRSVCGCKGATHLEPLWALGLGNITLAGSSLSPGEAFRAAAARDDMLLVAVTDLELQDEAAAPESPAALVRLSAGECAWINGGKHQFKNLGSSSARFVTFEF